MRARSTRKTCSVLVVEGDPDLRRGISAIIPPPPWPPAHRPRVARLPSCPMWKPNRGAHAAHELQMARLRGIAPGSQQSAQELADAIARFRQHVPKQTLTAQLATLELELHSAILSHWASVGYRDASHANDAPGRVVFPPTMNDGDDGNVRRIVHDLERLAPSTTSDPMNATVCVALCELGHFVLGNDNMVMQLTERTELLNVNPFEATPLNPHHVAVAIMGATVYGMANERVGETEDALLAYERASELYERAQATRAAPLADEMERWIETALYRYALLMLHSRSPKAQQALQSYEAHESRWPATFRQPQRRVIRACLAPAPAPAAAPAATSAAAGAGAASGRIAPAATRSPSSDMPATTSPRRPWSLPAPMAPYASIKARAVRLLQQPPGFPRADESNAHVETLCEQIVSSWRAEYASHSTTEADDVVLLLYGLAGLSFRSQTITRLLIHMLFATEAYAEAYELVPKYMALVNTAWTAQGVPPQRDTSALRAVDGPNEYVDTVLLGAHIATRYIHAPAKAHEWTDDLLLVGTTDKSPQHRFTMETPMLARVLRCAGEARLAQARAATPSERASLLEDARVFCRNAVALDGDASESHYALACILATERDTETAIQHARIAIELEPAFVDAWHLTVLLLSARKDFSGARSLAAEALTQIEADDEQPPLRTFLASFDVPPSPFARACAYIQLLITHNALVELTHGVQLALYGQRDLFSAYHARVAPLSPPEPSASAQHVPQFTTPGHHVAASTLEARRAFRAHEATQLLQRLWLVSAASFRRADNLEQARCAIAEAEQLDARWADVWVQLAQWCLAAGQRTGAAITCLHKALACDTYHTAASVHLARVLLHEPKREAETSIRSTGEAEDHARETPSRSLGSAENSLQDVAPSLRSHDTCSSSTSTAEALLRTVTQYRGYDVPEAWHALAQLAKQTARPTDSQRRALLEALRLEASRPIRAWHEALALRM